MKLPYKDKQGKVRKLIGTTLCLAWRNKGAKGFRVHGCAAAAVYTFVFRATRLMTFTLATLPSVIKPRIVSHRKSEKGSSCDFAE